MPLTLHAATIPAWLQVTGATRGLVDRAESWCADNDQPASALLDARLADDMWPFARQVKCVWMHSAHALAAVQSGTFAPDLSDPPTDFAGLRTLLDTAREAMLAIEPDTLADAADHPLDFVLGGKVRMSFTAQDFLLGFSNPNFYFHAATAFDILRMTGLDIGKRDYLGTLPVKP
ncbi:DUF1993 domain-containing protein [Pontixanthobacter sp.]|uniref:DUF1993 domain-containing protein n=1 Tax=Pontixanthobacter sp. TaxID=2792078 RepID=UPI003C7A0B86